MNPVNGVKVATVMEVADPLRLGRVLVCLPDAAAGETQLWARVAIPPQTSRGAVAQFDVSDEVLVAFAGGDPRNPFVVGKLWQGDSPAPTQAGSNGLPRPVIRHLVRPPAAK